MRERERQEAKAAEMRRRADELDVRASAPTEELAPWRGTPILVGHSSEGAHRRTMDRAAKVWDRQAADAREAERLRRDAAALGAKTERDIFDDDADAIERLSGRIAALENVVRKMKDGAIPSMGPLERKDQIASVRRKIRADRKRIEALSSTNEEASSSDSGPISRAQDEPAGGSGA